MPFGRWICLFFFLRSVLHSVIFHSKERHQGFIRESASVGVFVVFDEKYYLCAKFDRMRTRYRFMTATWLLVLSMVMLVATVVPHHHHWGMYCVALCDVETDGHDGCHHTSGAAGHNHSENDCCNGCITKFCCPRPSLDDGTVWIVSWDFFPVYVCTQHPERDSSDGVFFYQNLFYSAIFGRSLSLRAPPFCC